MQAMQSMLQNIQTNITNIQIHPQQTFQQKELYVIFVNYAKSNISI
jgi:hypothetical protein